jgi:hypothetical protein
MHHVFFVLHIWDAINLNYRTNLGAKFKRTWSNIFLLSCNPRKSLSRTVPNQNRGLWSIPIPIMTDVKRLIPLGSTRRCPHYVAFVMWFMIYHMLHLSWGACQVFSWSKKVKMDKGEGQINVQIISSYLIYFDVKSTCVFTGVKPWSWFGCGSDIFYALQIPIGCANALQTIFQSIFDFYILYLTHIDQYIRVQMASYHFEHIYLFDHRSQPS